jgi:hypothetical protein
MWNRLLVLLGLRTDWTNPDAPRFPGEHLYHAALDVLYPILGSCCCSPETRENAAEIQREIDRLRAWAKGLEDRRVRYYYGYWLDHFENELTSSLHDLLTHRREREMKKYQEREDEKAIARAPAKEWIPKPPSPDIETSGRVQ